jgi:hypothetical protein
MRARRNNMPNNNEENQDLGIDNCVDNNELQSDQGLDYDNLADQANEQTDQDYQ